MLTELVSPPSNRLLEVPTQYFESRGLHIAASQHIPDLLAPAGDEGLDLETLAAKAGIEARKLGTYTAFLSPPFPPSLPGGNGQDASK